MLGGGGHAKSCQDIVDSFRDYSISRGGRISVGYRINDTRKMSGPSWKTLSKRYDGYILGIGQIHSPRNRIEAVTQVIVSGGHFATLISPYARVSPKAKIGKGVVVMPNANINAGAQIDDYCIINTGAIVEHDAYVGPFCHVATGAVVNGDCLVKGRCFIGSNAVLLNQIHVCLDITVGAGSVVTKSIEESGGVYVGNPAKLLRHRDNS
jgi:sugar O-acyltransferase (sialic acid O-acetyltransferase NeuD family)